MPTRITMVNVFRKRNKGRRRSFDPRRNHLSDVVSMRSESTLDGDSIATEDDRWNSETASMPSPIVTSQESGNNDFDVSSSNASSGLTNDSPLPLVVYNPSVSPSLPNACQMWSKSLLAMVKLCLDGRRLSSRHFSV